MIAGKKKTGNSSPMGRGRGGKTLEIHCGGTEFNKTKKPSHPVFKQEEKNSTHRRTNIQKLKKRLQKL